MTSLPTYFTVGSASSAQSGVRDAIASYRRAQYLNVGSTVPSVSGTSGPLSYDEESGLVSPIGEEVEQDSDDERENEDEDIDIPTPRAPHDSVDELQWDDLPNESNAGQPSTTDASHLSPPPIIARPSYLHATKPSRSPSRNPDESTPLLRKAVSFSAVPTPRRASASGDVSQAKPADSPQQNWQHPRPTLVRRSSTASSKSIKHNYGGKSTFGQTLFNSIAILLGIGMLSEPLAFAYAGWIGGTILIVFYGFITCYTAKLLAHLILSDPRLRSYADIGRKAFGPRSSPFTSGLFFLELFALSVVLVTLYADSLHAIVPTYSSNTYKLWGLVVLIPTVFLPLSLLSIASILGILSTLMIIVVIFVDGLQKTQAPGSLWQPMETKLGIESLGELGVAFGLFMAGFSGHAVIPSLARDMVNPDEFDSMINWAFGIATIAYAAIGSAGYLMFGRLVSDEVSRDLLETPGFNPLLNEAALWMLVIAPLTKFALATRPLNITLEIMLGLDNNPPSFSPEDHPVKPTENTPRETSRFTLRNALIVVERTTFALLSVAVSILVPEFSSLMAFLGSFSAFILCVIYPVLSKVFLAGKCGAFDAFLLTVAIIMAAWGTGAAFWST